MGICLLDQSWVYFYFLDDLYFVKSYSSTKMTLDGNITNNKYFTDKNQDSRSDKMSEHKIYIKFIDNYQAMT